MAALRVFAMKKQIDRARQAESDLHGLLGSLEARRALALRARGRSDAADAQAQATYLKWVVGERRRLLTAQAAARAQTQTLQAESRQETARHAILCALLQKSKKPRY